MFKKSIQSFAFIVTILIAPTQRANAGIFIGLPGGIMSVGSVAVGAGHGLTSPFRSPMFVAGLGVVTVGAGLAIAGIASGFIPILALGEDGTLSAEQLECELSSRYFFIADREIILNIVRETELKARKQFPGVDNKIVVTFTEKEVREMLSPIGLNEEEIMIVVNDFK